MRRKWIRRSEAASLLGVSMQTVSNYASAGIIHMKKDRHGSRLYPLSEIEALVGCAEVYSTDEVMERIRAYDRELKTVCAKKASRMRFLNRFEGHWDNYRKIVEACVDAACSGPMEGALSKREREILSCVLELGDMNSIAMKFSLSRERIRQIFMKALRKLSKFPTRQAEEHERYLEKKEEVENLKLEIDRLIYDIKALSRPDVYPPTKETLTEEVLKNRRPYNIPLREIGVSVRVLNGCKAMGIDTVGDILYHDRLDFMKRRNFGRKSIAELELLLEKLNLKFGMLKEQKEDES